ncbi:MAG: hypothetical protein VX189_06400 [Planctomycetota bacterium]|nr:hypothetical protein [Planctomycetota bacterium]
MSAASVHGRHVDMDGEPYYQIQNSQNLPDFFMSIVGSDDHWMFVSSRGALTAGRRNPDGALFPYAADDQISAKQSTTGPISIFRFNAGGNSESTTWIPWLDSTGRNSGIARAVYKSPWGSKVLFEETHLASRLRFRYRWSFSPRFGFIRDCWLTNLSDEACNVTWLDGLQNLLPVGVGSEFWMRFSNLGNAYKKSELVEDSSLAMYYLSSIPSDRAEPSEGLQATVVWSQGLDATSTLLSSEQLQHFIEGSALTTETAIRGRAGAYLQEATRELTTGETCHWRQVMDLAKDQTDVMNLLSWLTSGVNQAQEVDEDVEKGEVALKRLIGSADGLQCGRNLNRVNRHFSNTLFNVMRGGIPLCNYQVSGRDIRKHISSFNASVASQHASLLGDLPERLSHLELNEKFQKTGDEDLRRLGAEYLPLAFSRRHGDPTRPWNHFSIDLRGDEGGFNLNYQGNWRDIFQNWEALGTSFPEFFPAMICRFVNATTADGYNAYRITKDGLEWEEPAPDDPWANIGYWCDHQIIYLLKLLEWNTKFHPKDSRDLLSEKFFVHAEVPYRIRDFEQILANPRETIDYDWPLAKRIQDRVASEGADGKLLHDPSGKIIHVTLVEKLLGLSLAKLSNFVPDGGVWLNTQRPEWNDANNALVGDGLSVVTTCYLHRWFEYLGRWIKSDSSEQFEVSREVLDFFHGVGRVISETRFDSKDPMTPTERSDVVRRLGQAGSDYRSQLYNQGMTGDTAMLGRDALCQFLNDAREMMESTIRSNRRSDGLYHAYNLLSWDNEGAKVETLYEMLEGQVAVLSSGLLSACEANQLLETMRKSPLFRQNQQSYMLYPDRQLPDFLSKNCLPQEDVDSSPLLRVLLENPDTGIVRQDVDGGVHFDGRFRNSSEVGAALEALDESLQPIVREHGAAVVQLFEQIFNHKEFTGRSGTFFAYEGLGSIYWHMVSKLGLAVSENLHAAIETGESDETVGGLKQHLKDIRLGIGAEKSPTDYGAFPSDPYSHTPENAGVKQPGMTGQVKEDVLARFMELGVQIEDGVVAFCLDGFDHDECVKHETAFEYFDLDGELQEVTVPEGGFGFTIFQVPTIYDSGDHDEVLLHMKDGATKRFEGHQLDAASSEWLFCRTGEVERIECRWARWSFDN